MRRLDLILLIAVSVTLICPSGAMGAKKSYHVSNYDIELTVEKNGDLRVIETIQYAFTKGTFTHSYRRIPVRGFDDIELVSFTSPDGPVTLDRAEVTGGWRRTLKLHWSFPETNQPRTFRIEYLARGVLRSRSGQNVLDWNAVGRKWRVPIEDVDVLVTLPWAFESGVTARPDAQIQAAGDETRVAFHQDSLRKEKRYRVVIHFPERVEITAPTEPPYAATVFVTLAAGVLVIVVLMVVFWRRVARVEPRGISSAVTSYPDSSLSVAEAASLVYFGVNARAAISSLVFDLARRGIIKIEATAKKGVFNTRSFDIRARVANHGEDLPPWDERVVQQLEQEPKLKKLGRKLKLHSKIIKDIRTKLTSAGLVSTDREALRRKWLVLSFVIDAAAIAFLVLTLVNIWKPLLAPVILSVVGGSALLIMSALIETRTVRGVGLSQAFQSYSKWVRQSIENQILADPGHAVSQFTEKFPELVMDRKVDRRWIGKLKKKTKDAPIDFRLPEWMELKDEGGNPIEATVAAAECFGLFAESVSAAVVYAGGAGAGGGGGGGGAGGGGGGAG